MSDREHPIIYEINAWIWLENLSRREGRVVTLGSVPWAEWDRLAALSMNTVWLMGVWTRSPEARRISASFPSFVQEYNHCLPDWTPRDIVGSPYAIQAYSVDPHLGGDDGLAQAREELRKRGVRLLLDFVPNHVAPDHPWLREHPEFLLQGSVEDLHANSELFFGQGGHIFARGRDPYFPPWPDTAQLNAFQPGLRVAACELIAELSQICDGVRCDMAMLLLNDVFAATWKQYAGAPPPEEYWTGVVAAARARNRNFLLIAEVYWGLENRLLELGFDYCYDKQLYQKLCYEDVSSVRGHLSAPVGYQKHLLRFLENHDEPRVAAILSEPRERAAAIVTATVPGAKLYFEGQLTGKRIRASVHLGREQSEPPNQQLQAFYLRLLALSSRFPDSAPEWQLCATEGWPDNQSQRNLLAWQWTGLAVRYLVVLNYSDQRSQARVRIALPADLETSCTFRDSVNGDVFVRQADELRRDGLFVDLEGWQGHLLEF